MFTTVPAPVKYLFDTFPLKEYPPVPSTRPDSGARFPLRYKPGSANDNGIKSTFQLGVYNLSGYLQDENILLPTDPICLSCQLIINLRNGLLFPQRSHTDDISPNFISVVSYKALYDNQLPMFIEEEENSGKRVVNSTSLINNLQMTRTTPGQLMKCLAIDSTLYDFWLITVLFELPPELQAKIYLNNTHHDELLAKLTLKSALGSLISRFGFENRNPHIAKLYLDQETFPYYLHHQSQYRDAEEETKVVIAKSKELLQLLESSLLNTTFLNGVKPHPGVLDCKLSAVIYSVLKFAPDTKFGVFLQGSPNLVRHSYAVIEQSL